MVSVMPPPPRRSANTAVSAIMSVPARLARPFPAPVRQASPSGTVSRTRWSGSPRPSDRGRGRKVPRGRGLRAGRRCGVEGPGARFPRVARQDALPPAPHARDPADPGPGDRSGTGGRDTGPALSGPAVRPVHIPVALPVPFPVDAGGGVVGFRRAGPAGEHTGRVPSFGARARGGAHRVQGTGCDGPAADVAPFRQTVHRGRFPAIVAVARHPHRRPGRVVGQCHGPGCPAPFRLAARMRLPSAAGARAIRLPVPGHRPSTSCSASGSTAANALWIVDLAGGPERPVFLFRQAPMAASSPRHSAFPDRAAAVQPLMSASVAGTVTVGVRATVCLPPRALRQSRMPAGSAWSGRIVAGSRGARSGSAGGSTSGGGWSGRAGRRRASRGGGLSTFHTCNRSSSVPHSMACKPNFDISRPIRSNGRGGLR